MSLDSSKKGGEGRAGEPPSDHSYPEQPPGINAATVSEQKPGAADSAVKESVLSTKKKSLVSWFYSVLPFNVAQGPFGTVVQLYILQLYGPDLGKIYVGLVITAFNAVTIPASMIWGFATDRIHQRKPMIYLSFFATGANLFAFLFVNNIFGIGLLYALFSLISSAAATPLNLLIMETDPKAKWASAFAKFSMISSLGVTIGLLLSLGWVEFFPFRWLVLPLGALSLVSGVMAVVMIKEPPFVFEREMIVMHKHSFSGRLLTIPMIFLRIPRRADFQRVFKGLRFELTSYVPILYMSIFAFYVGSGLFNTSLVPAMYSNSLSQSEVFLVILAGMVVQIISFELIGPFVEKRSLAKTAVASLILRSACYASLGVSAFLVTGILFIVPALVFYPIASGIAYASYYTASNTLVFNSLGHKSQGSMLGVYSALVGVGTMVGSLLSGITSYYIGFYVTFVLAASCLVGSAVLTSSLGKHHGMVSEQADPRSP